MQLILKKKKLTLHFLHFDGRKKGLSRQSHYRYMVRKYSQN